jgi:hypothetical protein
MKFDGTGLPTFTGRKLGFKTDLTFMDGRALKIFTVVFYGDMINEKS